MKTGTIYHGTKEEFPVEEIHKSAYFTNIRKTAEWFAGEDGYVLAARLSADKVYEIDWDCCSWGGGAFPNDALFEKYLEFASEGDEEEYAYWKETGMCVDMFASMMEADGYDLVIFRNVLEESGYISDVYCAFEKCLVIPA